MGNSLGGKKTAKVMKIDGETLKFKTPLRVSNVLKDYPDHVLMDSDSVRHLGVRAKELDMAHELKPKTLYFLVQLPALADEKAPRRVRSSIVNVSAKDRLENLLLSRRSVSDLSLMNPAVPALAPGSDEVKEGATRVKLRLPKAQVAKLVEESKDAAEAAEKIMKLCAANEGYCSKQTPWKPALRSINEGCKPQEKLGVRFQPIPDRDVA